MKVSVTSRKRNSFCIIFAVLLGSATFCFAEETNQTHSFGIYLIKDDTDRRGFARHFADFHAYFRATNDWSHLTLKSTPEISSDDIVSYNFTNHLMTLTPGAFHSFTHTDFASGSAIPFVTVADGQRIYMGGIYGGGNIPVWGIPSIDWWSPNLPTNYDWGKSDYFPTNSFLISISCDRCSSTNDFRSDERIRQALEALHKLK